MKYNLRKKHSLFELLSTQIKIFISICTLAIVLITGYIFRDSLLIIWVSFIDNLLIIWEAFIRIISNDSIYVFIGQFILIPISLVGLLYFVVDYGISLLRNRFIPLDKDELEANNIHNYDEYNEFLMRFLRGYYPLRKLRRAIENSALEYLLKNNYVDASLLASLMYWHKSFQQHKKKIILLYIVVGLLGIGIFFCFVPTICSASGLSAFQLFAHLLLEMMLVLISLGQVFLLKGE